MVVKFHTVNIYIYVYIFQICNSNVRLDLSIRINLDVGETFLVTRHIFIERVALIRAHSDVLNIAISCLQNEKDKGQLNKCSMLG